MWIKSFILSLLNQKTQPDRGDFKMAQSANYTDEQVDKMLKAYEANSSLDTVNQLVEDLGKTKASIISKLVSLGVYQKQSKAKASATPKIAKATVVAQVQALFAQELPSLKNMTVVDLQAMAKELANES